MDRGGRPHGVGAEFGLSAVSAWVNVWSWSFRGAARRRRPSDVNPDTGAPLDVLPVTDLGADVLPA